MKKPIRLLITDTHLHKNNVELVRNIFKQAIELCLKLEIKGISHLGDFFTSREAQPLQVLYEAQQIAFDILEAGLFLEAMPGNHDKVDLEATKSYVSVAFKMFDVKIVDDVINSFWTVKESWWKKLNIIWIPYFKEKGSYIKKLEEAVELIRLNEKAKNILLTHIGINGVKNNDGSEVENDLSIDLFKKFDYVYTGHYHNQSKLGKNIFYIGSAYQANYGEDENKGFSILYDDGSIEFVKSNFPKFVKIVVNIDDVDDKLKLAKKFDLKNDNIRFEIIGEKTKLQSLNKEKLEEKGIDVKFKADDLNSNVDISNNEITIFDRSNIKNAFTSFCEINDITDSDKGYEYLEKIL